MIRGTTPSSVCYILYASQIFYLKYIRLMRLTNTLQKTIGVTRCNSDFSDFKIIGHESIRLLRELKESLFIHQLSPELNKQIKSAKLFLF